ncbi:hypothetical protein, partial [Ruminococcus sp.]
IFPKYLGKYARKMRAGRYETGSEGKFASRWRAKSPDALCAVLPRVCSRKMLLPKRRAFHFYGNVLYSIGRSPWKSQPLPVNKKRRGK